MPAVQKTAKKRPASSQSGQKNKRARISKQTAYDESNEKRKQPVTRSIKETGEDSSESDDELLDVESGEESVEENPAGDEADVDSATSSAPNGSRESHKAQRALQEQRRAARPHSQLISHAKRVWSLARQKNIPPIDRQTHVRELMGIVKGNVKDIVLKHDASRIIQTIVKYGGQRERGQVARELMGHYKVLVQSKYSKFLVIKLIRLCPVYRPSILLEFQSHVVKLLLHREASSMLADAFELHSNAYERSILVRDFYGKEVALFSSSRITAQDIETAKKGFRGLLDGSDSARRKRLFAALQTNLTAIFNNPEKGAVTYAIVHRALWEFLAAVGTMEEGPEQEKLRREVFESCQDVLAEMVHTKDGSRVVREFIVRGTAKDRKHIVKVLKPHIERMCIDDEAQLVLFTALDVIDDTKLTAKSLVSDIISHTSSLATSPQGRRSLFYLIVPRSRRHFTPAQIASIAEVDGIRAKTSKKDDTIRKCEIRKAASETLLQFVVEKGAETVRNTGGSLLVLDIMLYTEGDKSPAMKALVEGLASPYPSKDPSRPHLIDLPHGSRMYKCLLQGGHYSHSTQTIVRSPMFLPSEFASLFLSIVGKDTTIAIAHGEGAFVVAELLERIREEGSDTQKRNIKGWLDKTFVARLKDSDAKGKNVLLEKIRALS